MKTFAEYMIGASRDGFPDKQMKDFLLYAKERYSPYEDVNWSSCDSPEERDDEVEYYLGNSMEALILFREFLQSQEDNQKPGKEQ